MALAQPAMVPAMPAWWAKLPAVLSALALPAKVPACYAQLPAVLLLGLPAAAPAMALPALARAQLLAEMAATAPAW